ncbi:MAG: DbpA RNA binding domain-containing protein, partial [Ruminococcus sp.]|nr:DbpA RNA binding domain-containing protein [Ruminococcus sp.]
ISGRKQFYELRDIERYTKATIQEKSLPQKSEIIALKKENIINEVSGCENVSHEAYDILDKLASTGIDYREAAARIICGKLNAEIESLPEFDMPKPIRKGRKGSVKTVKVDINIGRNKRIAPNFILGALVDATGMSGRDFGKIDIFDTHTTVEVPETEKDYILDSTNPMKINGNKVEVKLYNGSVAVIRGKRPESSGKPRFDRKKSAYGNKKKSEIYNDYIPNRKKRTKKRH